MEDPDVPPQFRATNADYKDSGYDRGHLAPASHHKHSQEAMDQTFFLTNISPQVGTGFNRDYWARFEKFSRDLIDKWDDVYICTGPLWVPEKGEDGKYYVKYEVIGEPPKVSVPTHFFKVILATNQRNLEGSPKSDATHHIGAFILPNQRINSSVPLESFSVPLETVEDLSGLTFFNLLPRYSDSPATTSAVAVQSPKALVPQALCSSTECTLPPVNFWKVPKAKKELLLKEVDQFEQSGAEQKMLPCTLTAAERKLIHDAAEKKGLKHVTLEEKGKRCIQLAK
uniref:R3H domain-containing protein n=1 Tax=Arcella intermedia TaxID=1963864 RepID=A0A6B2L8W6_9EUKA